MSLSVSFHPVVSRSTRLAAVRQAGVASLAFPKTGTRDTLDLDFDSKKAMKSQATLEAFCPALCILLLGLSCIPE